MSFNTRIGVIAAILWLASQAQAQINNASSQLGSNSSLNVTGISVEGGAAQLSGQGGDPFQSSRTDPRDAARMDSSTTTNRQGASSRRTSSQRSNFSSQNRNFSQWGSQSQQIRAVARVAFSVVPLQASQIVESASVSLTPQSFPQASGLDVSVGPGGVATLRGTVMDARQARLAAAVLSLEPGVRSVQNQLHVEPANSEVPKTSASVSSDSK